MRSRRTTRMRLSNLWMRPHRRHWVATRVVTWVSRVPWVSRLVTGVRIMTRTLPRIGMRIRVRRGHIPHPVSRRGDMSWMRGRLLRVILEGGGCISRGCTTNTSTVAVENSPRLGDMNSVVSMKCPQGDRHFYRVRISMNK